MGLLSGSATFERYWITKDPTSDFGPEHLEILEKFSIDSGSTPSLEQPNVGFLGGAHLLDTRFDLEKNLIGDVLHFGIRVDTNQIPGPIRNAWLQMELLPMAAENPSGKPTKEQRQEAKESVQARCEDEAATGKFRRMQQTPILWDSVNDVLYVGGSSPTTNELCIDLMNRAFGLEFDRITSGKLAKAFATDNERLDDLYAVGPSPYVPDIANGHIVWWNGMAENFDYLGNEFLIWLWWYFENESDTITVSDDSQVFGMFARTLTLDCPLGESGKESISAECPIALPEAELALRSGKQPRKAGLSLVRHGEQFDITLQAELFSVNSAKITPVENQDAKDDPREERIASLRSLSESLDLLYEAFCQRRISKSWKRELKAIQEWLQPGQEKGQRKPAA